MNTKTKETRMKAIKDAISIRFERYDMEYFSGILFGDDECWSGGRLYQWLLADDGNLYRCFYKVGSYDDLDKIDWTLPEEIMFWSSDTGDIADIVLKYCGPVGRTKIEEAFSKEA